MTSSTSVLDQMTQGILGPKVTRATKLTPVKGEESTTVADMVALVIPKDVPGEFMARESMAEAVLTLRAMAAQFERTALGLEVLLGVDVAVEAITAKVAATEAKLAEREADRKAAEGSFAESYAAKSEAAQAAAFTALDDDGTVEPAAPQWTCPTHGDAAIHVMTARKSGRVYRACGSCDQYEPAPAK